MVTIMSSFRANRLVCYHRRRRCCARAIGWTMALIGIGATFPGNLPSQERMPSGDSPVQERLPPGDLRGPAPLPSGDLTTPERLPSPNGTPAGTAGRLTLAELEQMALSGNPGLARAASVVGVAQGDCIQAGIPPNPTVGYEGQQLGSGGLAEQHGVLFQQELVWPSKLRLSRAAAGQRVMRSDHELAAMQLRVLTDVRRAYHQAVVAEKRVELSHDLVEIAELGVKAAEALFKAAEVGRADLVQAQLEVESSRIQEVNALNRRDAVWRVLSSVTGQPALIRVPLEEPAPPAPWPLDFEAAWEVLRTSSPEIAAALANLERARLQLQRARVEPLPNVTFQGLVNWIDNGIGGKADGSVALTFPVPAWNRNQGAIRAAYHEVAVMEHSLSQLELDLRTRLAPAFERYLNAQNQVAKYQSKILPGTKEALDLTRRQYQNGEAEFVTLLTAERIYSERNLAYLEALREMRVAEVEIDGMLLSQSLAR